MKELQNILSPAARLIQNILSPTTYKHESLDVRIQKTIHEHAVGAGGGGTQMETIRYGRIPQSLRVFIFSDFQHVLDAQCARFRCAVCMQYTLHARAYQNSRVCEHNPTKRKLCVRYVHC